MCLAVPAKVKNIEDSAALRRDLAYGGKDAVVDFGGVRKKISLGILTNVKTGDYVLVHAGFAIGKVNKLDAEDTLQVLKELKEISKIENLK
ncbi:MAG: HypC/HybG/HupF family hydrogenase formation chaperone [Candidatus Omnitrophota bacterium]